MRDWLVLGLSVFAGMATASEPATFAPALPPPALGLRVATYNTSLFAERDGELIARLQAGDANARKIAAVVQHLRPDVLLLNEFDYDAAGTAAELFQRRYLEVGQSGEAPISYDFRYIAPVNTGIASGIDLDGDGEIGSTGRAYGDDAFGYGLHPGQYGMLVLSRYPIDAAAARTFQRLLWQDLPGAAMPRMPETGAPRYSAAATARFRLSSKSHWDLPIHTPLGTVHFLVAHPTPPVFDGPEDSNGARNADELRLWREYIGGGDKPWLCDDAGRCGGLAADARFVIAGDLNNDPADGEGRHDALISLLEHPRVLRYATPTSTGAVQAAQSTGGANATHRGNPAHDTGDFGPRVGNMRLDYVLPSVGLPVAGSGVFWPNPGEAGSDWIDASDHRLVWVDLLPTDGDKETPERP
jgi:endonuclease/exonuclease/phosphatase family metal-dependent hydrolase